MLVGGLPLLFWLAPDVMDTRVLGMPLAWCLLGFVVYPTLVALGCWYVRAAERNERAFIDVVERPRAPDEPRVRRRRGRLSSRC